MIEMRKIGNVWVRPEAIEAITLDWIDDGKRGLDYATLWMSSGAAHNVKLSPDEVVQILSEDPIRSWGSLKEIRPRIDDMMPRD